MTPKEKAEGLLERFIPLMANEHYIEKAKECAFILIKCMKMENLTIDNGNLEKNAEYILEDRYAFWVEVRRELDLL